MMELGCDNFVPEILKPKQSTDHTLFLKCDNFVPETLKPKQSTDHTLFLTL
jgi:hypothetical protein